MTGRPFFSVTETLTVTANLNHINRVLRRGRSPEHDHDTERQDPFVVD